MSFVVKSSLRFAKNFILAERTHYKVRNLLPSGEILKKNLLLLLISISTLVCKSQNKVNTNDISHCWEAFDSIQTTHDKIKQLEYKSDKKYQLNIPKEKIEKEKTQTFKFLINSDNWQNAPENALNVEENGYGNLTLTIK